MSDLIPRERELVALGAAMGSNCVPCVEYHIAESRRVGLTDTEINEAIQHADKIRQVPARKTLQSALSLLSSGTAGRDVATGDGGASPAAIKAETGTAPQPSDTMSELMSKMMEACGSRGQLAGSPKSAVTNEGCGCR